MNSIEQREIEALIRKQTKVAGEVKKVLIKNFPVDDDLAEFIAFDTIAQAIGKTRLEEFNALKQEKEDQYRYFLWRDKVKRIFIGSGIAVVVLAIVIGMGMLIYSCATAPETPRTYRAIPETTRFSTQKYSWSDGIKTPEGLSDSTFQCINGYGAENPDKESRGCVNSRKLRSLNEAMDKAVAENIEGVIWNEATGDGEVWSVERNNFRFVITATTDPNYKK